MAAASQHEKAPAFRRLHVGPAILILPNAWDVASWRARASSSWPASARSGRPAPESLPRSDPDGERVSEAMTASGRHGQLKPIAQVNLCSAMGGDPQQGPHWIGSPPEATAGWSVPSVQARKRRCHSAR